MSVWRWPFNLGYEEGVGLNMRAVVSHSAIWGREEALSPRLRLSALAAAVSVHYSSGTRSSAENPVTGDRSSPWTGPFTCLFTETRSHCAVLVGLELFLENTQISSCFCLPSAETKHAPHHARIWLLFCLPILSFCPYGC